MSPLCVFDSLHTSHLLVFGLPFRAFQLSAYMTLCLPAYLLVLLAFPSGFTVRHVTSCSSRVRAFSSCITHTSIHQTDLGVVSGRRAGTAMLV